MTILTSLLVWASTSGALTPNDSATRYRVEISETSTLDLRSVGLGRLDGTIKTSALVTLILGNSDGSERFLLHIDSLVVAPAGDAERIYSAAMGPAAIGQFLEGTIVKGRVAGEAVRSIKLAVLGSLARALPLFFSGVRREAGEWSDTLSLGLSGPGSILSGRLIVDSRAESKQLILQGFDKVSTAEVPALKEVQDLVGRGSARIEFDAAGTIVRASMETVDSIQRRGARLLTPVNGAGTLTVTVLRVP
jgi:hypothetical protein